MLITSEYAFCHVPKTGGHALALMLAKAGFLFQHCPFTIENGNVIDSTNEKHKTFLDFEDRIAGKKKVLIIRRLDSWWLSYMWHQSKHTFVNFKGNIEKTQTRSYTSKKQGHLLLPDITCWSCFPDMLLQKYVDSPLDYVLRMEHLREDLKEVLSIDCEEISRSKASYSPPTRYWTDEARQILYRQNPYWANMEARHYLNM